MPRRRRDPIAVLLLLLAGLLAGLVVLGGCGEQDRSTKRAAGDAGDGTVERTKVATQRSPDEGVLQQHARDRGEAVRAEVAAREILSAAREGERLPRAFVIDLVVAVPDVPRITVRLEGAGRHGVTSAMARPRGLAAAIVSDRRLAIRGNRVFASSIDAGSSGWLDLGSASGVQLDVGRELLTHPMLTRVREATRHHGDLLTARLIVPAPALRAYAQEERDGPVSDLLARAQRLTIEVHVVDGLLTWDSFELELQAADRSGRAITIEGSTRTTHADRGDPSGPTLDLPPSGAATPGTLQDLLPSTFNLG